MKNREHLKRSANQPEKETKFSHQTVKLFLFKDREKKIITMGQTQNMYMNQSKKKKKIETTLPQWTYSANYTILTVLITKYE